MFHLALFIASFSVNPNHTHENGTDVEVVGEVESHFVTAFTCLRYSHLVVFALVFPDWFGDSKRLNKLRLYKNSITEDEKDDSKHAGKLIEYERQNMWMLISKCTETLQIFVY